jgi:hypothetical protein
MPHIVGPNLFQGCSVVRKIAGAELDPVFKELYKFEHVSARFRYWRDYLLCRQEN